MADSVPDKRSVDYWAARIETDGVEAIERQLIGMAERKRVFAQRAIDEYRDLESKSAEVKRAAREDRALRLAATANDIARDARIWAGVSALAAVTAAVFVGLSLWFGE